MDENKRWMPTEEDMQRYKDSLSLKDLFIWNPDKFGPIIKNNDKENPIIHIRCPFCDTKQLSYSLKYQEHKKIYYCEDCHKNGDVVSFYANLHHWTIRKTCLYFEFLLADKYNRYDLIYRFPLPPFNEGGVEFNPETDDFEEYIAHIKE